MTFSFVPSEVETLAYWINNRWNILQKRDRGEPAPWTTDPILAKYRFCNVSRQDDRTTMWLNQNYFKDHGHEPEFWHRVWLARVINWPPTLDFVGYIAKWDSERVRYLLKLRESRGEKVFSGAYIVSTNGMKMSKIDYVVDMLGEHTTHPNNPVRPTLDQTWRILQNYRGIGSFMAGQIVGDLKYHHPTLIEASDWVEWCCPGPGSMRGLNRILGLPLDRKWEVTMFQQWVLEVSDLLKPMTQWATVPDTQDLQNCLCEFDKYRRIQQGGKVRATYTPHTYPMHRLNTETVEMPVAAT